MIRQIRYFHSVVKNNSFSIAADECHISQSAMSQQIKALERELGFTLLERQNRKFTLTKAGEYFYRKSLVLISDYERIVQEAKKRSIRERSSITIGYLRSYSGQEFMDAMEEFSNKYPNVYIEVQYGNHEELYEMLRLGTADIVFNDQRRAFSNEYINLLLTTKEEYIEISSRSPLANRSHVTLEELKNIPCILVCSNTQRETEENYYREIVGIQSEFLFAQNLEEARMMIVSGRGFMPVEGIRKSGSFGFSIHRIPLYRDGTVIQRNYCGFWKKDNSGFYIEEFADILKRKFEE